MRQPRRSSAGAGSVRVKGECEIECSWLTKLELRFRLLPDAPGTSCSAPRMPDVRAFNSHCSQVHLHFRHLFTIAQSHPTTHNTPAPFTNSFHVLGLPLFANNYPLASKQPTRSLTHHQPRQPHTPTARNCTPPTTTAVSTPLPPLKGSLSIPEGAMATRTQSPRNAPRGPAANRRGRGGIRKGDRDGDLTMDISVKGRGRIGKATPPPNSRDITSRGGRGGRAGILSEQARSAILRKAAAGDVSMKEPRPTAPKGGLVDLNITGWENSKASSDADGGVSSLIKWMEKKASHRLGSRTREVRIKKVCFSRHLQDCCVSPCQLASISGPLSFAANLRTTTAIQEYGQCLPYG